MKPSSAPPGPARGLFARRKRLWSAVAGILAVLAVLVVRSVWLLRDSQDRAVVVSRETTYVTAPLHLDGTVDHAAAFRSALGSPVAPEENAAVPLVRAAGPRCVRGTHRAEILAELGLSDLPEDGSYLVTLRDHAEAHDVLPVPRSPEEYPRVDDWLAANERPLEEAAAASRRSGFSWPLLAERGQSIEDWALSLDFDRSFLTAGRILAARSARRLEEGEVDGAWEDAIASLRLGRLARRQGSLLGSVRGGGIEATAARQLVAILGPRGMGARGASALRSELASLPLPRSLVEELRLERLFLLDTLVQLLVQDRLDPLLASARKRWSGDPNTVLRRANRDFDRLEATISEPGSPWRWPEAYGRVVDEIRQEGTEALGRSRKVTWWLRLPFRSRDGVREESANTIADLLVSVVGEGTRSYVAFKILADARLDLLRIAVALAERKAERGSYPDALDELVGERLGEVPLDPFSGRPLVYRREGEGYLLYSIGANGRDDGGDDERDVVVLADS